MTNQPNLFDALPCRYGAKEGARRRDRAHAQLITDPFHAAVFEAAQTVVRSRKEFTSDDVWREIDAQGYIWEFPLRGNIVGSVMRQMAMAGIAIDTGKALKTTRANGHRRKITVWRSTMAQTA